jgi:uncharacterized protein YutE (UPF0331/DUF86 family)
MNEIEKKIQEAKNHRQSILNQMTELSTELRIREAQRMSIDSFIDMLNDLNKKMSEAPKENK